MLRSNRTFRRMLEGLKSQQNIIRFPIAACRVDENKKKLPYINETPHIRFKKDSCVGVRVL